MDGDDDDDDEGDDDDDDEGDDAVMFYCFDRLVCLNRNVYTEPSSKCGSESDWREGGGREDYIKLSGPLGRK